MKLLCTTITGADENTDVKDMIRIAKEFRNVEFGILISQSRAGSPRYPRKEWVIDAASQFIAEHIRPRFSYHICGSLSRDFVAGIVDFSKWDVYVPPLQFAQRIQLNVNIKRTTWLPKETASLINAIQRIYDSGEGDGYHLRYIVQHNLANEMMWYDLLKFRIHPHVLYDASGGRGKMARELSKPIAGVITGYSGGYNPDNIGGILEELDPIVGTGVVWVDVETGVRTEDNQMDMSKVGNFCDKCHPYYIW